MIVLKFGGTSVGSANSLENALQIIKSHAQKGSTQTVVASALGGVTNKLIEVAECAEKSNPLYKDLLKEIENRHIELCNALIPLKKRSGTLTQIKILVNGLEDICRGVFLIQELSARSSDRILSYGEQLSTAILNDFISASGIDVTLLDPRRIIKTDAQFGNAVVDQALTFKNIKEAFTSPAKVTLVPGFMASSNEGNLTTTLGRGGSDYTASLIASALNASKLEIWTDVSGMMTANPKMVNLAYPIAHLSYEEAMELSHFGAKVIYPPTIQPVLDKGIPIEIKNTFTPEDIGTLITKKGDPNGRWIKGLSSIEDVALCTLSGSGMVAVSNFSFRLFSSLSRESINVIMITQASSEHTITVGIDHKDAEKAQLSIENEFEDELRLRKVNPLIVEKDLSIIALVGTRMRQQVGVSARLFETLGHNGINVKAIAQGSTELNISVVIDKKHLRKSLNSLHESFFLSGIRKFYVFMIGVGNVGKEFLKQIQSQNDFLSDAFNVQIEVSGLANSKKMILTEHPIQLESWENLLEDNGIPMTLDGFVDEMTSLNLRNSIFIDCTGDNEIPKYYNKILKNSIAVVTPNKVACSGNFDSYLNLKKTATEFQTKFLFETNVGAGLPIISTLSDLLKSGDKIFKIKAVLSGTLNFLFNTYDGSQKFSDVIKLAKIEGYTEPDPRLDLSGVDVMRKILILARESGHKMELSDITNNSFVPEECMKTDSIDEFYKKLDEHDHVFQQLVDEAKSKNKRIKFVASFENKEATTGLESFGSDHPFFELDGKDNIVLFYTKRYSEQPLVVKGAGAGAAVTASGIFADVMRITSA